MKITLISYNKQIKYIDQILIWFNNIKIKNYTYFYIFIRRFI